MGPIHFDWRTLTLSADGVSLDNFSALPEKIAAVIKDPASNVVAAILMLAIVIVFIIVLVLTIIALLSRPKDPVIVESYLMETEDVDEEGKPIELLVQEESEIPKDPSRKYYVAITLILMLAVMWVVTGITTQVTPVCRSCHLNDPHVEETQGDPHEKTRCVSCHEDNGWLGTVTTAVPARLAHIVVGTFKQTNVPGYPTFPQNSCANCHGEVVEKDNVTLDEETGIRVSHYEPYEAGMTCMECHTLDENRKVTTVTTGMQPCLSCHNDKLATADCTECHDKGDKVTAAASPSPDNAQELVPAGYPSQSCYSCHNPAPCDSCHGGFRMPHPETFDHPAATASKGAASCKKCHGKGAVPCSECHGSEFGD